MCTFVALNGIKIMRNPWHKGAPKKNNFHEKQTEI